MSGQVKQPHGDDRQDGVIGRTGEARRPQPTRAQREKFERFQRVLRLAVEKLERLHLPHKLNESAYDEIREAMLEAGATTAHIETLASHLVRMIVKWIPSDAAWQEHFELITRHLACTDMTVRISKDDSYVYVHVEFPDRPKLQ